MRIVLLAAAVLVLVIAGFVERVLKTRPDDEGLAAPAAAIRKQAPDTKLFDCTISSEPTCELGSTPKVTVAVKNQTDSDIYLVGSLDGSDCKWRYPRCYFEVTGPDGKSAVREINRCRNMNTLREKDFVKVPPGGAFDPHQQIDGYGFFSAYQLDPRTFRTTGKYRIRFVYSTKSDNMSEWVGDISETVLADEKLIELLRQVPKTNIRSNEIQVTILDPGK